MGVILEVWMLLWAHKVPTGGKQLGRSRKEEEGWKQVSQGDGSLCCWLEGGAGAMRQHTVACRAGGQQEVRRPSFQTDTVQGHLDFTQRLRLGFCPLEHKLINEYCFKCSTGLQGITGVHPGTQESSHLKLPFQAGWDLVPDF